MSDIKHAKISVKKLKILILTTSFPLTNDSTSGIFVKRLAEQLMINSELKILTPDDTISKLQPSDVKTCAYAPKAWQALAHRPGGIPVALKSNPWLYLLVPGLLLSLLVHTLIELPKKQLVLANWSINALIAAFPCWLFSKKLVIVLRGEDVRIEQGGIKRIILELALRVSDKVVLVSSDMEAYLAPHYPQWRTKFQVIANGVDQCLLSEKKPTIPRKKTTHPLELLSVGSLIPRKSIDKIIKSIAHQKLSSQKLQLTIIGGGVLESQLQELCSQLKIQNRIKFTGQLSPTEVYPYYNKHQVFILASSHEGRPNVLVEAMAAGCCVIASRINGTKEIITHNENGLLFSLDTQDGLTDSILSLIENPQLVPKLGRNARQTIIDLGLTWQNTAKTYETLCKKLL